MSFISLHTAAGTVMATDQLVFSADDKLALGNLLEQSKHLAELIASQEQANQKSEKQGFEAGRFKGLAEAEQQARGRLAEQLVKLQQQYNQELAKSQATSLDLALDIVRKIAGEIAPAEWLYAQASKAADELAEQDKFELRVNPTHVEKISQAFSDENAAVFTRVVGDDTLSLDACRINTQFGKVDVDLETQLGQIRALIQAQQHNDD